MTEGEAKTKWCPFTRIAAREGTGDLSSYNRYIEYGQLTEEQLAGPYDPYATGPASVGLHPAALCIGSACMAWRRLPWEQGYCGLAGSP